MRIEFTNIEIDKIKNYYLVDGLSTKKIGEIFNVSPTPIKRILKKMCVLKGGKSNGIKIVLTETQKNIISDLYLNKYKNSKEIGKVIGCSGSYVEKYLSKNGLIRSRSEASKLSVTGRKVSKAGIENMKLGQKNLVLSGKRIQSGGICKTYIVENLSCRGTYEKSYIEYLLKHNEVLPKNCNMITTPYGGYYPDFKYSNKLIEIKSPYTYDVLMGKKKSRWTNEYENKQLAKIKWVNQYIMPVQIIVVEKNNIKEIKLV